MLRLFESSFYTYYFFERWAGPTSGFDVVVVPTLSIKDSHRLVIEIGDVVACFLSKLPHMTFVFNNVISGIRKLACHTNKICCLFVE